MVSPSRQSISTWGGGRERGWSEVDHFCKTRTDHRHAMIGATLNPPWSVDALRVAGASEASMPVVTTTSRRLT
jgi:hypothetical protein